MRILLILLLAALQSMPLLSSDKAKFRVSAHTMDKGVHVGEEPLVLIRLTNSSDKVLYFNYSRLEINYGVTNASGDSELSATVVRASDSNASGGSNGKVYIGKDTIGIPAGQGIIKIVRLSKMKFAGPTKVTLVVTFPVTPDLNLKSDEWSEIRLVAEISIPVQK